MQVKKDIKTNNIYNKIITLTMAGIVGLTSCDSALDINRDPDLIAPSQLPINSEMPAGILGTAAASGSYFAIVGGFWSQYWTQSAIANQYKMLDDYTLENNHQIVEDGWSHLYDALLDTRVVKKKAKDTENWNYYLMATVMEVYASQLLVDMYGTIPYTEGNNKEILQPKFNSAQEVYDLMAADLKEALSKDLKTSSKEIVPGEDDFVFKGDMDQWRAFAHTLLLRLYLRQTEVRPEVAEKGIKELLDSKTEFLTKDAAIKQFEDKDSKSNPLYESDRRKLNVATNLRASKTLGSFLQDNKDSRLAKFYNGTIFQDQGDYKNKKGADASVVILHPEDPVYFISKAESYFLQAEAEVRYNGGANAQSLYEEGVKAAFQQFDLDGGTYLSGAYKYPNGKKEENIKVIITQKWISLFPGKGYEAFIEQNRTGYPEISKVPASSENYIPGQFTLSVMSYEKGKFPKEHIEEKFPKRLEIPQDVTQRNPNAPTDTSILDPVWYDAN